MIAISARSVARLVTESRDLAGRVLTACDFMAGSLPATATIRCSLVVKACAFFARSKRTVFALVPWTPLEFGWHSARFNRGLIRSAKLTWETPDVRRCPSPSVIRRRQFKPFRGRIRRSFVWNVVAIEDDHRKAERRREHAVGHPPYHKGRQVRGYSSST